ncbi:hypothetical protein NPIL_286651 [Nephila pilipes]|uniref:Uncharacterized protein n=1 Tax=Nephila pilipes TaxID=299642 RepID=A0A8X6PPV2_NEPPI|nr:hypothetical protein NPIL_286651 [Nephila pilipes]
MVSSEVYKGWPMLGNSFNNGEDSRMAFEVPTYGIIDLIILKELLRKICRISKTSETYSGKRRDKINISKWDPERCQVSKILKMNEFKDIFYPFRCISEIAVVNRKEK